MELDRYGLVIRRRLPLIVAIVVLTALVSTVYAVVVPTTYKATTQLLIDPLAPQNATAATYYYPPYYQEQAAQYILDDFSGVVQGTTFAQRVIAILQQSPQADVRAAAARMTTVDDAQRLSKQFTINRINRLLQIQVQAKTRDEALAIEQAVDQLIVQEGPGFFSQLTKASSATSSGAQPYSAVTVTVSDQPHIIQKPSRLKDVLFWLLRVVVGLVAGVAIALVLHYFDDHLYDEYDAREMLDLPVLGSVQATPATPSGVASRRAVPARAAVTTG